jgi:bacillithiol system protein YtxJ
MVSWIQLTDVSQLEELDRESYLSVGGVAIFKHSTRCSISSMALNRLEKADSTIPAYFLDLLSFRGISNEISARYQVEHESPQLIIIKYKKAVFHTSHHMIRAEQLML